MIKVCENVCVLAQWLRLCSPKAGGLGSIPGQGARSCMPQLKDRTCSNEDPAQPNNIHSDERDCEHTEMAMVVISGCWGWGSFEFSFPCFLYLLSCPIVASSSLPSHYLPSQSCHHWPAEYSHVFAVTYTGHFFILTWPGLSSVWHSWLLFLCFWTLLVFHHSQALLPLWAGSSSSDHPSLHQDSILYIYIYTWLNDQVQYIYI